MAEIEKAWARPQEEWARKRLLVVRLIAQHELTVEQIMKVADVSRQTVFTYRDKVVAKGWKVCCGVSTAGDGGLWCEASSRRSLWSGWRRGALIPTTFCFGTIAA